MQQQILSVSQINQHIQALMDNDPHLTAVAIRGEVSNYKVYPSGHHYFTIKDENASLRCVMFRSNAMRIRFRPESGMQVVAVGKISVYPRDGAYQLYCSNLILDGVGDLYAAFEQLKKKLSSEGLFDQAHKKKLPQYPAVIGVITSSAGAAIHDILRILRKRYPLAQVRLLPVRVQGAEAPEEISAGIAYANLHKLADLLIVGRGGGSIEDLWAFNDERVARAIYQSDIPVISAVGHEPDVTISDFVADLRAATPSNAAELAVPDQDALKQTLDGYAASLYNAVNRRIKMARQQYNTLVNSAALTDSCRYVHVRREKLSALTGRLSAAQQICIATKKEHFIKLTSKLDVMSPLKVLSRGFAIAEKPNSTIVRSVKQLHTGDIVKIRLSDGTIPAAIIEDKEISNE